MPGRPIDPYSLQHKQRWLNRLRHWRANPDEAIFHGLALAALLSLALWLLLRQLPLAIETLRALLAVDPLPAAAALMLIVANDHWRARRAQRRRWADDWLAAQPVAAAVRQRRRRQAAAARLSLTLLILLPLLAAADAHPLWLWALAATVASAIGHVLAEIDRRKRPVATRRERIVTLPSVTAIRDWQWIEAGAMLAPKRLSLLLFVVLLVPRGPVWVALIALLLVLVATAIGAWLRAVAVIPQAQRWLAAEPIALRRWLRDSLWLPPQLLGLFALVGAGIGGLVDSMSLALLLGALPTLLGGLHLGAVVASRARPRRAALESALQMVLLMAVAQALPPAVPVIWLLQMSWLFKRGFQP